MDDIGVSVAGGKGPARSRPRLSPVLIDLAADRAPRSNRIDQHVWAEAADHRMLGLVHSWAPELALTHDLQVRLAERAVAVQAHLHRVRETLRSSVERLSAAGLEVATLKGVTAEDRWYARSGERPCGDVDLWMSGQRQGQASEALRILGPDHPWIPHIDRMVTSGRLQAVTISTDGAIDIDLHFDPLKLGIPTRANGSWWDRTVEFPLAADTSVRVLDDTASLLQFLVHLNKDRFQRLLGFADVARVIGSGRVEWEAFHDLARADGIEVAVLSSLEVVVDELGLAWPGALPRPSGTRARLWSALWPPRIRLRGSEGRLRYRMRQNGIGLLARGRAAEAAWWWTRDLWPPRVAVELQYADVAGPYLWKLLRGRWRGTLAQRRGLARVRLQQRELEGPVPDAGDQGTARPATGPAVAADRAAATDGRVEGSEGLTDGSSSVRVPSDVLVQKLPDGDAILVHLATEECFTLDGTGTAMWDALVATGGLETALGVLRERFDIPEDMLRRDLEALVSRLAGKGLLLCGGETDRQPVDEG